MGRSTGISGFLTFLRAISASAFLAAALSCSDSTAASSALSRRDPALDGVKVVVMQVPDSLKNAALRAAGNMVLGAPRFSRDVTVEPDAPAAPSAYTISSIDYNPEPAPSNFLLDCDDCVAYHVPIGFNFSFYGATHNEIQVASNGLVRLGSDESLMDGCCSGWGIPGDDMYNNIIPLAWTDLSPSAAADIRYETQGTAPNRKFVVQWNNVPEYLPGTGRVTAQIVLSEGSNEITMNTASMNVNNEWHLVTQGIENADGSEAAFLPGRVQEHFVLSNDAIRFKMRPQGKPITLVAAANISVATDARACFATVALVPPTVSGGGEGLKVEGTRNDRQALDAEYPLGVTTITWAATDALGTTEIAGQTVTVADHEGPQITLPPNVVVGNDPGLASANVDVGKAHVEDNCPNYSISDPANGVYPVGVSEVVWTASDEAGNTSSATQLVTVKDVEAPTIDLPPAITVNATSKSGAIVSFAGFGHDNVGVTSFACNRVSGTKFPIGKTSVSCSAVDAAGNKSAPASLSVTVLGASQQIVNLIEYIRPFLPIEKGHSDDHWDNDGRRDDDDHRGNDKRRKHQSSAQRSNQNQLLKALASAQLYSRHSWAACQAMSVLAVQVRIKTPSVFPAENSAQILTDIARIKNVLDCH